MAEVARLITRRDKRVVESVFLESGALEGIHISHQGSIGREHVPLDIEQCGSQILTGGIALVEGVGALHLGDEFRRHRLPGLVVLGVVGQHRRISGQSLIDLRREFHEIGAGVGASEEGIGLAAEHAVQRMAELMEEGGHIIEAQQAGLPWRWLHVVAVLRDHRLLLKQGALIHEGAHPGTTVLVVAGEVVPIEQSDDGATRIDDVEHAHIGVVYWQVFPLLERESVEFLGGIEDAVHQHTVELQVGLQCSFVQVVFGLAHLLAVEVPIPCFNLMTSLLLIGQCLQLGGFGQGIPSGIGGQSTEQFERRFGGLGHLVVHHVRSPVGEAQELCFLGAQLRQTSHDGAVVGFAIGVAAGAGFVDTLAQAPIRE